MKKKMNRREAGHLDVVGERHHVEESAQFFDDVRASLVEAYGETSIGTYIAEEGGFNGLNTWTIVKKILWSHGTKMCAKSEG